MKMAGTEDESDLPPEAVESEPAGDRPLLAEEAIASSTHRAKEFFNRYDQSFRRYGAETSLSIEIIDPDLAGKGQPESWAIDLERGVIYADPKFFLKKEYELADSQFAIFHEVEHFREIRDLLNESDGYLTWQRHRKIIESDQGLHLFDNCLDDIRMNRTVVSRASSLETAKSHLYQDKLFPESDFRSLPRHLQFAYTILRESELPDQSCEVDEEVRLEIDNLHQIKDRLGRSVIDVTFDPRLLPSQRLKLQEQFFVPTFKRFRQEDLADRQGQPPSSGSGKGGQGISGDQNDGETKPGGKALPGNAEDIFKEYYDDFFANSPDAAVSQNAINAILEQYAKDNGLDLPLESRNEAAYARAEGVSVQDLRSYRRLWEQVSALRDPETDELVIEQLRAIFRRIIAERTKPRNIPYAPQSEGEVLINPVQAYVDVLAGKEESEAWLTHRVEERPAEQFGQFDVTLICDRSISMQGGQKGQDQLCSAVLLMEALKEFSDELDEIQLNLEAHLRVRTEVRSFGVGGSHDILKPLGSDLSERQRVAVAKALRELPGSTPDFLPLEDVLTSTSEDDWAQISSRELRKIVIPLSDGESADSGRTQRVLSQLREKGVAVAALGMGEDAGAIETTYAPDAQVVVNTKELAATLAKVLERFLEEL